MYKTLLAATAVFTISFFSCHTRSGDGTQFLGTWKNKQPEDIKIKVTKEGEDFLMTTLISGQESGKITYKLAGDVLVDTHPDMHMHVADSIVYITASKHIYLTGLEWERTGD